MHFDFNVCLECTRNDLVVISFKLKAYFLTQFEGQEIAIDGRMGIFITMNPGYAGRTELPESVKALFRPVVVIVPDLQQICEIMLFSEGFLIAKVSIIQLLLCMYYYKQFYFELKVFSTVFEQKIFFQ